MDQALRNRLTRGQSDFLLAIQRGPSALVDFYKDWSQLHQDVVSSHAVGCLTDETLRLSDVVAAEMETLAEAFLGLEVHIGQLTEEFISKQELLVPSVSSVKNHLPTAASEWLCAHLDDPYPSKGEKMSIATLTATTSKTVDSWFANSRKSIGWTTLSQNFFGGSRTATSAAARQVYRDGHTAPSISPDIAYAFLIVKLNAEKMHSHIVEMQPDHSVVTLFKDFQAGQTVVREPIGVDYGENTYLPFPDEDFPLPTPVVHDSDDEEDTTPPPQVAGHKRRSSGEDSPCDAKHANAKRPRLQRSTSVLSSQCTVSPSPDPKRRHISMPTSLSDASSVPSMLFSSQHSFDVDLYLGSSPEITSSAPPPISMPTSPKWRTEDGAEVVEKWPCAPTAISSLDFPGSSSTWSGLYETGASTNGHTRLSLELFPDDYTMPPDMAFLDDWNLEASARDLLCDGNMFDPVFSCHTSLPSEAFVGVETAAGYPIEPWPIQPQPFHSPALSVSSLCTSVSSNESSWESSDSDSFSCDVGWDYFEAFLRSLTPDLGASSILPPPQPLSTRLMTEGPRSIKFVGEPDICEDFCIDFN
ncbi:hypothetical protein OF83DRAFT_1169926 [Amylostereum chailletii]|nr:hypothetical protein OF83DRAFT_1169926 [Amylostereum chailletii]